MSSLRVRLPNDPQTPSIMRVSDLRLAIIAPKCRQMRLLAAFLRWECDHRDWLSAVKFSNPFLH
jgi:hypothetical protein